MALLQPSVTSLPLELIEEIIVITTLLGDTRVAATLSRTCHSFHALVYHQFSKHLWREMFLVVFDCPFLARDVRTHGRAPLLHLNPGKHNFRSCPSEDVFPWEDEYKRRIWTGSFILQRTQPPQHLHFSDLPSSDVEAYTVLQTLLRVISTAAPLPYDALACVESHPSHPPRPHPICPPLFVASHMHPTLILNSRNTTWIARILAHGLPRALIARLSVYNELGEADAQKRPVNWDSLLVKLVAQIGLMTPISTRVYAEKEPSDTKAIPPLPSPTSMSNGDSNGENITADVNDFAGPPFEEGIGNEDEDSDDDDDSVTQDDLRRQEPRDMDLSAESSSDDSDFQPGSESTSESDDEGTSEIDGDEVFGSTATQATLSLHGVRRLARIRVYNMAYLRSSRAFGPFLPVGSTKPICNTAYVHQSCGIEPFLPGNNRSSKPSCSTGFFADGEEDQGADGESSSTDVPPLPSIPDSQSPFFDSDNDYDDDDYYSPGQSDGEDKDAFLSGPSSVAGDQLRFDWAWIAAARVVIELNLRDLLMNGHRDVLRALLSLEGLRPCSAPGFPLATPEWSAPDGDGPGGEDGRRYRNGEGWDWAGVEGQWRRCVCWLDYGDLLTNNSQPLAQRFSHPALYEVMRIIPLTIRISHYTRAPAAWPGRPTIHVVGEWHTTTQPDLTRVRGTVEMAASGDVRWTLTSSREDGDGEWASEGVQLGGRGSAMGVIGMWTSAEHEPSDPLGPFWAWKVGPVTTAVTPAK